MLEPFILLGQSRKAVVAVVAAVGVIVVTCLAVVKSLPVEPIVALIGALTGMAWKLIGAIADEDNSKRGNIYGIYEGIDPNDIPKMPSGSSDPRQRN